MFLFSNPSTVSSSASLMSSPSASVDELDLGIWLSAVGDWTFSMAKTYLSTIRSAFSSVFLKSSRAANGRFAFLDIFRFVALCWVIINHLGSEGRLDILRKEPSGDKFKQAIRENPIFAPLLGNSALGVEIFLLLSGLLAAHSWQRHWNEERTFLGNTVTFLVRRWLRLAPPVFAFILLAISPLSKWAMPQFHLSMASVCTNQQLLSHALFLNNWQTVPTCFGWLWYLGLDWQCYLMAPFLLYLLGKMPRAGSALCGALIFGSMLLRGWHCRAHGTCNQSDVDIPFVHFPASTSPFNNSTQSSASPVISPHQYSSLFALYARPATKLGPFLIGLLIGFATVRHQIGQHIGEATARRYFATGLAIALAIVYGILPEYWHPTQGDTLYNTLYTATFRTAFAAAIGLMVIARLGRANRAPVSPVWTVLAQMTFSAFLVHMPVVFLFNHVGAFQRMASVWGLLLAYPFAVALSFGVALIFHCLVESPLARICSFH